MQQSWLESEVEHMSEYALNNKERCEAQQHQLYMITETAQLVRRMIETASTPILYETSKGAAALVSEGLSQLTILTNKAMQYLEEIKS